MLTYSHVEQIDSLLYLRGERFQSDNKTNKTEVAKLRNELFDKVVSQLHRCPNSVIVLDEAEKVYRRVTMAFEQFLDGTHPIIEHNGFKGFFKNFNFILFFFFYYYYLIKFLVFLKIVVKTNEAIFIIVTDFGRPDHSVGFTLDELIEDIQEKSVI